MWAVVLSFQPGLINSSPVHVPTNYCMTRTWVHDETQLKKEKKKKRKPKVLRSSMHAGWPHTLQQAHKQKDLSKCQPYRVASDPVFQQFGCKWRIQMWKWYKKNFKHLRRYGMMLLFMKWAISSSYSEFDSPINLSYITLRISVL